MLNSETSKYPRVLIVGQSFDLVSGGGITLSHLFQGWPKASLAVAGTIANPPNWEVCNQYYQIGTEETPLISPLRWIWHRRRFSGPLISQHPESKQDFIQLKNNPNTETSLIKYIHKITKFIGFQEIIRRVHLSPKLLAWVNRFHPDLIYTQSSSLHSTSLAQQLADYFQLPTVIHMMDDWPSTVYANCLLSPYLRWRIDKEFAQLLSRSSCFMGISDKMCSAYQERYGYPFVTYSNPLDLNIWKKHARQNWIASTPFTLMYRGRIGKSVGSSLVDICDTVYSLYKEGLAIRFDIFITSVRDELIQKRFERNNCVFVHSPTSLSDVPQSLAAADLLILCYDFDPVSIQFIRLSMPTKAPEYMASGTPILVYAPPGLALVEYAAQSQWGYVVSVENQTDIENAIRNLMNDQSLREQLGKRAKELAAQKHDSNKVREEFRLALVAAASQKPMTMS